MVWISSGSIAGVTLSWSFHYAKPGLRLFGLLVEDCGLVMETLGGILHRYVSICMCYRGYLQLRLSLCEVRVMIVRSSTKGLLPPGW